MVAKFDHCFCFAGFGTDRLRRQKAMKTAGRENPNATVPCNRANGAEGQNRSCSIRWAAKQENFQPEEMCFFLTSPFIELTRPLPNSAVFSNSRRYDKSLRFTGFSKGLPYDRHEFAIIHGLFEESYCAGLHGTNPVIMTSSPGDNDDRD
jgi:hypothetical protein